MDARLGCASGLSFDSRYRTRVEWKSPVVGVGWLYYSGFRASQGSDYRIFSDLFAAI